MIILSLFVFFTGGHRNGNFRTFSRSADKMKCFASYMHGDRFEQVAVLTFKRKSIVFPQNLPQAATFSENRT